uniref:Dachshund n=1 Tax=Schmidtea mediterranea TaxID=79327 RepID=H9B8J2_SCHMD|nr:dachshund [Schmidtea mediterranea]
MDSPMISLSPNNQTKPVYCTPNPVPNIPENNQVSLIDYRCAKIAAFTVEGRQLICLPQAFELFLKHLVGGLHTVYTKLKRLEIVPVVCNVEQVRILRGLGAIQPGVNRCKLIAPKEFDILFEDCTNSSARPGRPSKRATLLPGDLNMSESIKRAHYELVNDCVKSGESINSSYRLSYDDEKRIFLRNSLSQHGFCPIIPPNLGFNSMLPFGMTGSILNLFPHNQSIMKQFPNLPSFNRLPQKDPNLNNSKSYSKITTPSALTSHSKSLSDSNTNANNQFEFNSIKTNFDEKVITSKSNGNANLTNKSSLETTPNKQSKTTMFTVDNLVFEGRSESHNEVNMNSPPANENITNITSSSTASTSPDNFGIERVNKFLTREQEFLRLFIQHQMKNQNDEKFKQNFYDPLREFWRMNVNMKLNQGDPASNGNQIESLSNAGLECSNSSFSNIINSLQAAHNNHSECPSQDSCKNSDLSFSIGKPSQYMLSQGLSLLFPSDCGSLNNSQLSHSRLKLFSPSNNLQDLSAKPIIKS